MAQRSTRNFKQQKSVFPEVSHTQEPSFTFTVKDENFNPSPENPSLLKLLCRVFGSQQLNNPGIASQLPAVGLVGLVRVTCVHPQCPWELESRSDIHAAAETTKTLHPVLLPATNPNIVHN